MMKTNIIQRRQFLKSTAATGIGLVVLPSGILSGANAPSNKISVACIGVRGRGNSVMNSFAAEPDCAITHICDVREATRRKRGAEMKQKTGLMPKLVNDYRTLLDDKSVDVFMVATPDHWHALPTIHGCLADKDVYVEKPASHNILEGKTAVAAARKRDRMVQVGTQTRSAPFEARRRRTIGRQMHCTVAVRLPGHSVDHLTQRAALNVIDGLAPTFMFRFSLYILPTTKEFALRIERSKLRF